MSATSTMPRGAWVPRWWTCPDLGDAVAFYFWCMEAKPPIQVEERMGEVAVRHLADGHSPARTRKLIGYRFPKWAHLAGELVDAVIFAMEGKHPHVFA